MKLFFIKIAGFMSSCPFVPQRVQDFFLWPVASRVLGLEYKHEVELKDGFKMWGSLEDILSRKILFMGWYERNLWEPATSQLLEKLASESEHVLIAGAHMGYLVLKAAKCTKGSVHAFEPIPALYERTKENLNLNPELKKKVLLTQAALGETEDRVVMYSEDIRSSVIPYSGGHVSHQNKIEVSLTTIDAYAEKHGLSKIDLILLDIEGFEWFALNGASSVLEKKPKLILEISPRVLSHTDITPHAIFNRLRALGYRLSFIDDYAPGITLYEVDEVSEAAFLERDYVNIYAEYHAL